MKTGRAGNQYVLLSKGIQSLEKAYEEEKEEKKKEDIRKHLKKALKIEKQKHLSLKEEETKRKFRELKTKMSNFKHLQVVL